MAEYDELFTEEQTTEKPAFNKEEWLAKKQQFREDTDQMLDNATSDLSEPSNLYAYLDVQARFDRYSVSNAILIAAQMPNATRLADFESWKKQGVNIKKGEKGIAIYVPGRTFTKKDGTEVTYFDPKKVFDISQTTAEQKDVKRSAPNEKLLVKALVKTSPVDIRISNQMLPEVHARYSKEENTIYVQQGLPGQKIFKALLGEILTARLERSDNPKNKFFVEPVAYILCKRNGINPPAISDATMLAGEDNRAVRKLLEVVRNEANNMSNTMERTLHPKDRGER